MSYRRKNNSKLLTFIVYVVCIVSIFINILYAKKVGLDIIYKEHAIQPKADTLSIGYKDSLDVIILSNMKKNDSLQSIKLDSINSKIDRFNTQINSISTKVE